MSVHLHCCIVVGRWKFEDWHLYRWTEHRDAKTGGRRARWWTWDKLL